MRRAFKTTVFGLWLVGYGLILAACLPLGLLASLRDQPFDRLQSRRYRLGD